MTTATVPKPKPMPVRPPVSAAPAREVPQFQTLTKKFQPPRIILNAVEGWGKTTAAAYAENPALIMTGGETGYETLFNAGLVPAVPTVRIANWQELLDVLNAINGDHQTIAIDALGGAERMCHEFVCRRDFDGDWGERGFASYQKGYDVSVTEWLKLLAILDRLHDAGKTILILSHCKIKTFKNPLGADYDRYVSDVHDKTWSVTAKWADAVLFGNFYSVVETNRDKKPEAMRRGKGIGGTERVIYTERRDAFDAKNRYGMPEVIDIPHDPSLVWETIYSHIRKESK